MQAYVQFTDKRPKVYGKQSHWTKQPMQNENGKMKTVKYVGWR